MQPPYSVLQPQCWNNNLSVFHHESISASLWALGETNFTTLKFLK